MSGSISVVEDIVREYPFLLDELRNLRDSKSWVGRDPTATAASVKLSADKQRRLSAVGHAYQQTKQLYDNGTERMAVIAALYWGANEEEILASVSAATAEEWKGDFLDAVSEQLGLRSCTGCIYRKPLFRDGIKACLFCYETGQPRIYDGEQCFSRRLPNVLGVEAERTGGGVA